MIEQGVVVAGPITEAQPLSEVEQLAQEIMVAREKSLKAQIGDSSKREIMWFGDVHDCSRHNFYSMVEGDQRTRWDEWVQAKLNAGREWEQITKRELSALGYEPMLAGEVVEIKNKSGQVIARGRTDMSLARIGSRKAFPVEAKQMQPHIWSVIETQGDFLKNPWLRKYFRQISLYMYGKNIDEGLFLLGDFQGHWKLIPIKLDYDFVEDIISKIEAATQAKRENTPPDRIPYDHDLCGKCQFAAVCIPDVMSDPRLKVMDNAQLSSLLERRDEIMPLWSEVEKIDKQIKAFFENVKEGVFTLGDFIITRKSVTTTKYETPEDVRAKYAQKVEQYRNKIERFAQPDPG